MKKKILTTLLCVGMTALMLSGCGEQRAAAPAAGTEAAVSSEQQAPAEPETQAKGDLPPETEKNTQKEAALPDGVYSAKFTTDNSMFHINEAYNDLGTLTVENGEMMIHITLASKNILNLFPGTAEDAKKEGAELLMPTTDTVEYPDGSPSLRASRCQSRAVKSIPTVTAS